MRRRLERADQVTAAEYADAQAERELLRDELASAFGSFDLLLSLTSGSDPIAVAPGGGDVGFRRAAMACAAPQSLAGLPACALPAGSDERGMPVGVQLTGPPGSEPRILAAAAGTPGRPSGPSRNVPLEIGGRRSPRGFVFGRGNSAAVAAARR